METIKINFDSFWADFDPADNYFTRILSRKYKVELSNTPDLYFFTHNYGNRKRGYIHQQCHRVFLGWENIRANWNIADYVLDSDFYNHNPRHKRWPIWAAWDLKPLVRPKSKEALLHKKKFACMVVSNAHAKERIEFFHLLSKYKPVDSGGRYLNNVGGPVADKRSFINNYRFVISFENSSYPGYTTEKLIEPMLVNSIPVYWGNPQVHQDFNTRSFVNVNNFKSFNEAAEYIVMLDEDEEKLAAMAAEPWFQHNEIPHEMTEESLVSFFDFVIEDMKITKPVAQSLLKAGGHRVYLAAHKIQASLYHRLGIHKGFR